MSQPLLLLDNDSSFDRVLIVEFPSARAALALLRSPQMRTLRSVINGVVHRMALASMPRDARRLTSADLLRIFVRLGLI